MNDRSRADSALDGVIIARTQDLGDNFEVRRALPSKERRMVGPFVFLDQMGPHVFSAGRGLDVRPHPHIGLATVTYLFDGEIIHRDSLGSEQVIRPGDVNWMTAGRGIVHSERTSLMARRQSSSLSGLQCWVALPKSHEETNPSFVHIGAADIPVQEGEGTIIRIIAGSYYGQRAPIATLSDLFYADVQLQPNAKLVIPSEYPEQAIYIVQGTIDLSSDGVFGPGQLLVIKPGKSIILSTREAKARCIILGGEPLDGPRAIVWNFVSSSLERIEQAKDDWKNNRFLQVPGETEYIPLPNLAGKPVFYP